MRPLSGHSAINFYWRQKKFFPDKKSVLFGFMISWFVKRTPTEKADQTQGREPRVNSHGKRQHRTTKGSAGP